MTDRIVSLTGVVDRTVALTGIADGFIPTSHSVCIEGDGGIVWQPYSEINNLYMRDALTIEGWYRVDSWDVPATSDLYMFDKYNYSDPIYYGWQFYASPGVDSIDYMYFEMGFSYTSWIGASFTPLIANGDWYHIALTLNYTTSDLKIYLNGISQSLAIQGAIAGRDSTADDSAEALHMANHGRNWSAGLDGRIGWSQIHNRIKYTENFTPPSRTIAPRTDSLTLFSMPLDEGAGITVSSADGNGTGTFTPGVGAIDWCPYTNSICMDNGASVDLAGGLGLDDLFLGDFTIEMWVKPNNTGVSGIFHKYNNDTPSKGWHLDANGTFSNFTLTMYAENDQYAYVFTNPGVYTPGAWHHIAVTFTLSTGVLVLYVGGSDEAVLQIETLEPFYSDVGIPVTIGGDAGSGPEVFDGCYQWINITNTVKYTAGFTPPARTTKPSITDSIFNVPNKEGEGSTVADVAGDYTGTFNGAVWE